MAPVKPSCRIGLTGDVGSGKSRVLSWFASRGAAVLDADQVVHELLAADAAIQAGVAGRFGRELLGPGGTIDRGALAARVFQDADARRDLEAILHPKVRERIGHWLDEQAADIVVVEAIYLVGSPLAERFDQVWLLLTDAAVRRERLRVRGWTSEAIAARMAAAPPLAPRLAAAAQVIDNSGPWAATEAQLLRALARCGRKTP
jgi:dephospho-CoA kinase